MQYGFFFNARRCTGCRACALACKDYHDLPNDIAFRQVFEFGGGDWSGNAEEGWTHDCFAYYVSSACNHCAQPACVEVCPTGAMHKDDSDGLVTVNDRVCIGCGYCALACPYRAPKVDRELGHSVKCDGCRSRVKAGGQPICVEACPMRAIEFGDYDTLAETHGTYAELPPMPERSITLPSLVINPPACADGEDGTRRITTGRVRNLREIAPQI